MPEQKLQFLFKYRVFVKLIIKSSFKKCRRFCVVKTILMVIAGVGGIS